MMLLVLALFVLVLQASGSNPNLPATNCDFETPCAWRWNANITRGFRLVTGQEAGLPPTDANNDTHGKYGAAVHCSVQWAVAVATTAIPMVHEVFIGGYCGRCLFTHAPEILPALFVF
jgi:hypothetical protein